MKETFYFSHDYGARNDPKLQHLLMVMGHEGKGIFWDLIEMLYEQSGYLIISHCDNYAFALRTDKNKILSVINDFGLFQKDEKKFWSASVLKRLRRRKEKSFKAKSSAIARWSKTKDECETDANALRTQSERNAIKESKVKENKVKKRDVFTPPELKEVVLYFSENGYTSSSAEKAFKFYSAGNWKDSNGKQVKNWKQKMQGVWFKDENKVSADMVKVRVIQTGETFMMDKVKFENRQNKNEIVAG